MTTPLGLQDADGRLLPGQGLDPLSHQLAVPQMGAMQNDPSSGLPYAPQLVSMAIPAIVQKAISVSAADTQTQAVAFNTANIAGNSIVVVCGAGNNGTLTVTDSLGNTYTKAVLQANSTTFEAAIFFAVNVVAGANTVTVTNAGAAASMAVQVYEVSGLLAQIVAQPGQFSSGTGTGTTASTSAIASGVPNALAFLGVAVGTTAEGITNVSGAQWTADSSQNSGGTPTGLFSFGSLSQFLHSPAPVTPQATIAASKPWAAASAVFRPVALPVQGTVWIGGYKATNITTQTTTLVKTGPGVIHSIIINKPLASGVIEIDDALTQTNPMGTITLPATLLQDGPKVWGPADAEFKTGLSITTSGATQDITVLWK